MKAFDLIKPIEDFAPICSQEQWDNCGFSIGNPSAEISKVLIALDCTESVMDEAIALNCEMIITHHPLIFGTLKSITTENNIGRIISKGIKHNITVYSAHTNMDKASGGVSCIMAEKIGLTNQQDLTGEGFGIVGDLKEPTNIEPFIKHIKKIFCLDNIRCSKLISKNISRVAVCGGSGKDFIKNAYISGADVYITGDISYHDFYCENDFMVIDIGHYSSELGVVSLFTKILSEKFPTFAIYISKENINPIYYY